MTRHFREADYAAALQRPITVEEALPPEHLARWLVTIIAGWDLAPLYARYEIFGPPPYAPASLLAILLYGYMTGTISTRALETATQESLPFRYLAAFTHPDHTTLARFRQGCLPLVAGFLAQALIQARQAGVLAANPVVSVDGSKIHADASKHHAVSYAHACTLRDTLLRDTAHLLTLSDADLLDGMDWVTEIVLRLEALEHLASALAVLEARAQERYQAELADYQAKLAARARRAAVTGRKPGGRPPRPPSPTPDPTDQYNFTDPDSRVMKNGTNKGFDQHYNAQAAVDQTSRLIVGYALSNHPNDKGEATAALDAIPPAVGPPRAAALDTGYLSVANILELEARSIIPLIALGKGEHGLNWRTFHQPRENAPPPPGATPMERVAHALQTAAGHQIYGQRKSTVEPTFGTIKETMGFRQFSLRGLAQVTGEWGLVCLAYDLKRLSVLLASAKTAMGRACREFATRIAQFTDSRGSRQPGADRRRWSAQILALAWSGGGLPTGGGRYATSC
jgi:transposase